LVIKEKQAIKSTDLLDDTGFLCPVLEKARHISTGKNFVIFERNAVVVEYEDTLTDDELCSLHQRRISKTRSNNGDR
jgi:hypothetical protein